MINRLIDMEVKPFNKTVSVNREFYSIGDYANAFIKGMGETQRNRFRKMLENGIKCGMSVADSYGIDYEDFIKEVKKQMGVK